MRPYVDIRADYDLPAPPVDLAHADDWAFYCERVSERELADMLEHETIAVIVEHRAGALAIPEHIAADVRLCARDRYALAAMLGCEADTTQREARAGVIAQLFGECDDMHDRALVDAALERMVAAGVIARTAAGGYLWRAAT